ncbi:calcium-binding protein [Microvirga sp. GCM10011540]|uniref:calcium-binding protein n=1 Tax=Microvirga sp. GCM10011540 TaxID=3317338 RepID=UPI0036140797
MTYGIWGTEEYARLGQASMNKKNVVAALPNGGYVVGFQEGGSIYFQRYDGAGVKAGGPTLVAAADGVTLDQFDIHAVEANGNFAVTWTQTIGTVNSFVMSRVFDINGTPLTAEPNEVARSSGSVRSSAPSTISTDNGGYITAYNNPADSSATDTGVEIAVQNAAGGVTSRLVVSNSAGADYGEIAKIDANKYVVSYQDGTDIKFKIIDFGSATPVPASEVTVGQGRISDVVVRGDGSFVVVYNHYSGNANCTVKAQFYTAQGEPVNSAITLVTSAENANDNFEATMLRDGRVAVVYSERNPNDPETGATDFGNIYLKIIGTNGQVSAPLLLNSDASTDGNDAQVLPSVVEMTDGRLAVTWYFSTGRGSVSTTIVDAREAAVAVNGTNGNDVYAGSEYHGNVLNGHGGNDKLIGGSGSDALDGGEGIDVASYERSAAGVIVSLAGGPGIGGDAAGDTYANIENVIGSQHGDTITGDDAANHLWGLGGDDVFIGGGGQDTLEGGAGNDSYHVDGNDVIVEAAGGGIDTVYTSGNIDLSALANIENIVFTGTGPVNITGTAEGNALNGGAGGDGIDGGGGNDVISGNDGNDSLYGGTGEDVLSGGSGFDYLRGDAGNDTLDGGADNDFLDGGVGFDFLVGNVGDDTLNGGADNDVLDGGLGSDNLIGDLGDDALFGGDDNDILIGGVGNDRLDGGAGNDKLYGKEGKDFLVGGSGRDIFVFDTRPNKRTNLDKVDDFNVRDDSIYLENKYFKKLGKKGSESKPAKLKRDFFKVGTKALDKNDHLVYNKKKGILYYDADGSGRSKAVEIAKLDKNLKMSYKDFFVI